MSKLVAILILSGIGCTLPTAILANEEGEWSELLIHQNVEPFSTNWNNPEKAWQALSEQQAENQILRIDQEVLVLKAELARQHGDLNELRNYLNQLDKMAVLPAFQQRVDSLKQSLIAAPKTQIVINSHLTVTGGLPLRFPDGGTDSVISILLPLTGVYEKAGNQLLESLTEALTKTGYSGTLVVLDTAIYDSAFELWQVVKYYEPDFIFGPLQKEMAQQWQALNTSIPTLYFNELESIYGHERALSPSKSGGLKSLISFLESRNYHNVLVLTDQKESSKQLESAFYSLWLTENRQGLYQPQSIERTVGEAVEVATNIQRSKGRRAWLQKVTDVDLYFNPRARADIDVVVSFVSESKAIQIEPALSFYQLENVPNIWYPAETPKIVFLKQNLSSWRNTFAVLPAYLYTNLQQNRHDNNQIEKNGLFYALGQVAIEIVKNSAISDGANLYIETEFGAINSNLAGQFHLLPMVFRMEQRALESVSQH